MRRLNALAGALSLALAACAQPAAPPGGPPDPVPPQLVAVSPDSGATNVRPDEVVFRFDEVIAERPSGATTLEQIVLISPRDGTPQVRWRRDALEVRPARGWRANTTYVLQLLPGVADLRGNVRDSSATVVFSTGPTIPATQLSGAVFDWAQGTPVPNALVFAYVLADSAGRDSVMYAARADSSGRYVLPYVPAGPVLLRGGIDENRNRGIDPREAYDEARVVLADSQRVELYAFIHDTVGTRITDVTVVDSVTLRVALDLPLAVDQAIGPDLVRLLGPDSAAVPLASVLSRRAADSLRAAAADTLPPDTAAVTPDTAAVAPIDTVRADSLADSVIVGPPVPSRPTPVSGLEVRVAAPLAPDTRYRLLLIGARNLSGASTTSERVFTTPEPPPPPTLPSPPAGPPPAGPPR